MSEISDGVMRMGQMIDDLLSHARLDERFTEVEDVNLDEVIEQVKKDLASDIANNKAVITIHGKLPVVPGNRTTLEALLQNLLSNAIKFVETACQPEINIKVSETSWEYCTEISDNGIGIDEDYQQEIFNLFERLHTSEEYPGTGIGLSIAKKVVQLHGGKLWVRSEPGRWSTFYFSIDKNLKNRKIDRRKTARAEV